MKKTALTFFICLFITFSYSQKRHKKLPKVNVKYPTIMINNYIIANQKFLDTKKDVIAGVDVLKDNSNKEQHSFFNLTENGIVFITVKKDILFKTQDDLNNFFKLPKNNDIYVNGYLLEHKNYKIASESIVEIEVIEPNSTNKLRNKILNIWTLTKKERSNGCPIN